MIAAAADALATLSDSTTLGAPLRPPMTGLRTVSAAVGAAVATSAADEGLAQTDLPNPVQQIHDAMWLPEYPIIELTGKYQGEWAGEAPGGACGAGSGCGDVGFGVYAAGSRVTR